VGKCPPHITDASVTYHRLPVVVQFTFFRSNWNKMAPFLGHVACSDPRQDYRQAISVSLRPPSDHRRPRGRPCTTWHWSIDADEQSVSTQPKGRLTIELWCHIIIMPTVTCHWKKEKMPCHYPFSMTFLPSPFLYVILSRTFLFPPSHSLLHPFPFFLVFHSCFFPHPSKSS